MKILTKKEKAWIHDHLEINPDEGGDDIARNVDCPFQKDILG